FRQVITSSAQTAKLLACFAGALALAQICSVALTSAILAGTTGMTLGEVVGAGFFVSGALIVIGVCGAGFSLRGTSVPPIHIFSGALILAGSVMNSHSYARIDLRWGALALTAAHHLAGAAWIGGLLYLLITLRQSEPAQAARIAARF